MGTEKDASKAETPLGKEGGFELIFRDRYLMLVALLTVLLNVVNSTGEFLLSKLVVQQAHQLYGPGAEMASKAFVGEFYAHFFGWVNLVGLVLQMLFVSRIFRYIGVRGSLFILPSIALTGYTLILIYPALRAVRLIKILENSTDYSVQNTARQALFLPTSREAKYKAKEAVDTFFRPHGRRHFGRHRLCGDETGLLDFGICSHQCCPYAGLAIGHGCHLPRTQAPDSGRRLSAAYRRSCLRVRRSRHATTTSKRRTGARPSAV